MNDRYILRHALPIAASLSAIGALFCAAPAASGSPLPGPFSTATGLSIKVLSRSAPAGGAAQLTITLTEPKPIATGFGMLEADVGAFDAVLGAALFSGPGAPSEVAGTAVIDGTSVKIHAVSPSGTFGTGLLGDVLAV